MNEANGKIAESAKVLVSHEEICMSEYDLKFFPKFESRPSAEFVDGWRKHISQTGSPETYIDISTTKPPRDGPVILLSDDIHVPTSLRLGGERVPCPLCSPKSPKFENGRLAYFPQESAVRCIGIDCARKFFGSDYTEALRLFRIEAQCAAYIAAWPALEAKIRAVEPLALRLLAAGSKLEDIRVIIDVQGPGFARFLYNDLVNRGGLVVTSRTPGARSQQVEGLALFASDFRPRSALEKIVAVCRDIRKPLPNWSAADGQDAATKEIMRRGKAAFDSLKAIPEIRDLLSDALSFFKPVNLRRLEKWTDNGSSPFASLNFKASAQQVQASAVSFEDRYEWSVMVPENLLTQIPTKEEISVLNLSEILN
ncbi:hypothetical protein [Rhizobium leguminosarum]|uniref:hypothetical protein n=1 Tax=Rhizobium leguminosarum TaxID=384 RepID=UPI001C943247|nr:hypothetical protein [Rhizobium leguminosarum]MBY5788688.1 hypothetical protein [Rhizobium leguminosarum]